MKNTLSHIVAERNEERLRCYFCGKKHFIGEVCYEKVREFLTNI